jgi:hypothetical protein
MKFWPHILQFTSDWGKISTEYVHKNLLGFVEIGPVKKKSLGA